MNKPTEWVIELIEKEDRIPQALADKDALLDSYNNEIDILTHAFSFEENLPAADPATVEIKRDNNPLQQ